MPLFQLEIDKIRLADIEQARAIIEKRHDMPMQMDHFLRYCIVIQINAIIESGDKCLK